jgi:multicomponent Na+:H+ antiporter subunit E
MTWLRRAYFIGKLFVVFLYDLWVSSIQVALAVLKPEGRVKPRMVTIPLRTRTDVETTLVGNFISLTPGTLTVDVAEGPILLVHDMFAGDSSDQTRTDVQEGLQKRVMEATQ